MATRSSPRISLDDRSGDVLVWSSPPVRRIGGSWVGGAAALRDVPSADELKDFWSPVLDGPERDALLAEADAALRPSSPSVR